MILIAAQVLGFSSLYNSQYAPSSAIVLQMGCDPSTSYSTWVSSLQPLPVGVTWPWPSIAKTGVERFALIRSVIIIILLMRCHQFECPSPFAVFSLEPFLPQLLYCFLGRWWTSLTTALAVLVLCSLALAASFPTGPWLRSLSCSALGLGEINK